MAKRPSVKEILEAARRGGPAQPSGAEGAEPAEAAPVEAPAPEAPSAAAPTPPPAPATPPANVPTPSSLGRPLSLKEKLAAARAGGAAPPPGAAPAPAAPAAEAAPEAAAPAEAPKAVPPPAAPVGRPLTLKEKLAAARGAAPAGGAAPAATPAAKPAAPAAAKAAPRTLPPLEKITDPKDLAEAARQTGAKKVKEAAAKTAEAAPAPAKPKGPAKEAKPQSVLPRPSRATASAAGLASAERRGFLQGSLLVSWVVIAWSSFAAGSALFIAMMGRFMFPNVLAEPPSTIKIGLPSNFDPEDVNERFKAEWGFWIVRSTRYDGNDIIYALQSVCTHLGCPPNWLAGEQKFKCPCHGSGFYISGINFEGPAPRPLERFKVSVADDGQIIVDKSQKFQQELGQWSDPDSFITA